LSCSCLEQGSSALAKDIALGLKRGRVNLSILVENVDGRASGIGKVDNLLSAHVPPHLDAFGLELSGVDHGPTQLHVKLSGEFVTSFVVNPSVGPIFDLPLFNVSTDTMYCI
jgi:hypothetical protein